MPTYEYREVLQQVQHLTADEQLQLLEDLAALVRHRVSSRPRHNSLEFKGLGKEIWSDVNVEEYL